MEKVVSGIQTEQGEVQGEIRYSLLIHSGGKGFNSTGFKANILKSIFDFRNIR